MEANAINIQSIFNEQKSFFREQKTLKISFRREQLKKLKRILIENEEKIFNALKEDLSKPFFETYGTEIAQVIEEINFATANLNSWSSPERVRMTWVSFPSKHYIYSLPHGVILIIGAWNYPILLTLAPLVGAMAAGNCAIIKPSELAKNTSSLLLRLINENFDRNYIKVVEGGADETQQILSCDLDYIFFTGSPQVGRIIMQKAADRLIPVTLELGGKSPCIVDEDSNLEISARRVIFGKMLNAGQTCVAPDFLVVHKQVKKQFLELLKGRIEEIYGDDPQLNEDVASIINENHYKRLTGYLNAREIFYGGKKNDELLKIGPTILTDVDWNDQVMQEEVFGPILPVLEFENLEDLIDDLNDRVKPLAAYYFSKNRKKQNRIIEKLNFGGGVINDAMFQFGNPELPIGGIGRSGIGQYHGKYSFDTFSHKKSIVKKPYYFDMDFRYPPYKGKLRWLKWIFKL